MVKPSIQTRIRLNCARIFWIPISLIRLTKLSEGSLKTKICCRQVRTTRYDSILWWASACLSLQTDNGLTTCKALKDKRALARMRSLVFSGWSWNNTQSNWNFLVGRVDQKKYWWLRNRWLCKAVIISNTYEEQASPAVLARPHDALRSWCLGAVKEPSRRNFRNHPPD